MSRARQTIYGTLLLAMPLACASAIPQPSAADAARGGAMFPELTLAQLQQGRQLYVSRCGSCHVLKRPGDVPSDHWQAEVTKMRTKNGVKLSDQEAQAIVRYLVVAATAG